MSVKRINVRWDGRTASYKADVPEWEGGEVVPSLDYAALEAENASWRDTVASVLGSGCDVSHSSGWVMMPTNRRLDMIVRLEALSAENAALKASGQQMMEQRNSAMEAADTLRREKAEWRRHLAALRASQAEAWRQGALAGAEAGAMDSQTWTRRLNKLAPNPVGDSLAAKESATRAITTAPTRSAMDEEIKPCPFCGGPMTLHFPGSTRSMATTGCPT